jgi:methenyltetrahydromethanopterin cyclohydrolase
MTSLALNARAWALADDVIARAGELRIETHVLPAGTRVIDAGVDVLGGVGAGLALARICMGGLGDISTDSLLIDGLVCPGVQVRTDNPAVACMASQYAGWPISVDDYFAIGSGPLRAIARVERELFARLGYNESSDQGVLVLEGRTLPTAAVAAWIAERARLDPACLTLLIAPTASLACGVQVVSRILETGMHKMDVLDFDLRRVVSGIGTAPLPPVARNDLRAVGRTNDAILYGGEAHYHIDAEDEELRDLAIRLPASASADYGTPFYEVFKRYGGDFYGIDPLLFSPARVALTSTRTGQTFRGGTFARDVLETSFYGAQ